MPSDLIERIVIREEQELRDSIASHPLFADVASLTEVDPAADYERELKTQLRHGTELSPRSHGPLFDLIETAAKKLGLAVNVRLFKSREGGTENAFVVSRGPDVLVVFQDGILATLDEDRSLLSVLGHELGHHAFGHSRDLVKRAVGDLDATIANVEQGLLTGPGAKELRRLSRDPRWDELVMMSHVLGQIGELNSDRAGLVCVENLEDSVRGSMLLSGGPSDRFGRYDPEDFLAQAHHLVSTDEIFDDSDAFSTHPLPPLRVLALEYFRDSDVYRDLTGRGSGKNRLRDFGKLLPSIVPLGWLRGFAPTASRKLLSAKTSTTPSAMPAVDTETMTELEINVLTWMCLVDVISADGKVTPAEKAFVEQQIRPLTMLDAVLTETEKLVDAAYDKEFERLLERAKGVSARTRTALVKRMIKAAKADRRVTQEEIDRIRKLAQAMDATAQAEREIANVWGR